MDSYENSAEPCDKPCKGRKIEKCGGSISKSVYGLIDIGFNGVISLRKPTLGSLLGSSYNKPSTTIQTTTPTTTSTSPFSLVDNKCLNSNQLKSIGFNPQYQIIDLKLKNISCVDPSTFLGYTNLQKLNLKQNNLTKIVQNNFNGLDSLRMLDLSSNQIGKKNFF